MSLVPRPVDVAAAAGGDPGSQGWERICPLSELPFDAGTAALINQDTPQEAQIALFRPLATDTVFAIDNFDPFSGVNVLARGILCSIGEELAVASPILKQHFSLATGRCIEDDGVSVTTYPVSVRDGVVFVRCRQRGSS
jgi:NAD(P)H-dependent nitrite reductase small subunit